MSNCHNWYNKLNKLDGEYQQALQTNAKNDLTKRLSIMLKGKCCGQTEVDAIEYYEEKIEDLVASIGEPLLNYHLFMLAITNDVNLFYRMRLFVFLGSGGQRRTGS